MLWTYIYALSAGAAFIPVDLGNAVYYVDGVKLTYAHAGTAMDARHDFSLFVMRKQFRTVVFKQDDIHLFGSLAIFHGSKSDGIARSHALSRGM